MGFKHWEMGAKDEDGLHFIQEAVVRNSTREGKWMTEERHIGQFPFSKGLTHDIVVYGFKSSVAVKRTFAITLLKLIG